MKLWLLLAPHHLTLTASQGALMRLIFTCSIYEIELPLPCSRQCSRATWMLPQAVLCHRVTSALFPHSSGTV